MILNQRMALTLLNQYISGLSKESCKGAASLILSQYGWMINSLRVFVMLRDEWEYVGAIDEIILNAPKPPTHPVIDCSEGKFYQIAEALAK